MLAELDDYDWGEVFGCAGELDHNNNETPQPIVGYTGSIEPFTREDVAHILAKSEGENDERSWMIVVELKDGRFAYIEAGCDYTGWDCSSNGSSWVADSFDSLWHFGLTNESRERLADAMILYLAKVK